MVASRSTSIEQLIDVGIAIGIVNMKIISAGWAGVLRISAKAIKGVSSKINNKRLAFIVCIPSLRINPLRVKYK